MCYGLMIYSLTDSFSLISQCWLGQVEVRSAPRGPSARRTPLHVCDPALSTNVSNIYGAMHGAVVHGDRCVCGFSHAGNVKVNGPTH